MYLATKDLIANTAYLNNMGQMLPVAKEGFSRLGKVLCVVHADSGSMSLWDINNTDPEQLDSFLWFSILGSQCCKQGNRALFLEQSNSSTWDIEQDWLERAWSLEASMAMVRLESPLLFLLLSY